ncbi:MAG TPA: FAD binding domain-containing protein [Candidatus Dormibacteraeota bacterium]|nr:FAD binding domain-containing protein [Candidatus Dormibacteraeota bacterium]
MSMSAGSVARPKTVEEAVRILAGHGPDAMVIAGGTDVVPNLQMKLFSPGLLVDIKRIASLRGMHVNAAGELRIGALTTLTEVANSPLVRQNYSVVAQAVATVAGPLQRNMGTIGGNLCLETRCRWYNQSAFWRKSLGGCLKKDGPICHVAPGGKRCWAAWSGDSAPAFLTLGAEIELSGPQGVRRIPLQSFYRNDGIDRIALGRDELLTAILVPPGSAGRHGAYHKLRIRNSIDYPLAGVAIALEMDANGICRDARIAITAVNPAPLLLSQASEWLVGKKYSHELAERVAHAAIQTGKPLTTSASTPVYRRDMLRLFTRRALEQVWKARTNSPLNSLAD